MLIKEYKELLEREASRCIFEEALNEHPDPLIVAKKWSDEYSSLICASFAYGNAKAIVGFLNKLDFEWLELEEDELRDKARGLIYRFQTNEDLVQAFITLSRLKKQISLEELFYKKYQINNNVLDGIEEVINTIYDINTYRSHGYNFLFGQPPSKTPKSPYKRWHMFLRWMVRDSGIDLGLWKNVSKSDLLMPLDVHTFKMGQKMGLIKRKSYDSLAVMELTNSLKKLDKDDPLKYDFALYRIGQMKKI